MSAPSPPAAPPLLDINDGAGHRTFELTREIVHLGRRGDNDIQVIEAHVSKRHARILRKGESFAIVDLGSKAGVFVNGVRVGEQDLLDGDVITLGSVSPPTLVFRRRRTSVVRAAPDSPLPTLTIETLGQGLDKLAMLLESSRLLSGRFTLAQILDNVVDLAIEITRAERGFLILRRPDGSLDYKSARRSGRLPIEPEEIRVSQTIVTEALTTGVPRIVPDVQEEVDLVDLRSVGILHLRSVVALPLFRFSVLDSETERARPTGEVFGVLYLDSRDTKDSITRIDRGILESLALDASSAIENARLFREAEEKRAMEAEFERAREVQAALLPRSFQGAPHFEVSGQCVPSRRLGGDYYDQFSLSGGRGCFVMADVAGKGMPAALLAAALQGVIGAEVANDQPLGRMVERINRVIFRLTPDEKFVTLFCCVLGPTGALAYVNAGHCPALVVSEDREVRKLFTGDMALGILESSSYRQKDFRLRAGDVIALFTDGVTEAANDAGDFFEEARLQSVLVRTRHQAADAIVTAIMDEVKVFSGGVSPRDDITLMVVKYLGRPGTEDSEA